MPGGGCSRRGGRGGPWWRPGIAGDGVDEAVAALTDPLATAGLAGRNAELAGIEVGFDGKAEPDGGKFQAQTGEHGTQNRELTAITLQHETPGC
jgi:hypothetical protein